MPNKVQIYSGGALDTPPAADGALDTPSAADGALDTPPAASPDVLDTEMVATIPHDVEIAVSASTKARMIAMTAPEKPITHADLIAKSESRRVHARLCDNTDLDPDLHHHVRHIADTASLSPHAANLCMLNAMFGKADVLNHPEEQIHVLLDVDGDGDLDKDDDEYFTFIKYDGSQYEPGHGRYKCDYNCSRKRKPPHNCGYHPDYLFPINFSPCSRKCKGAFCKCIRGGTFDI